ncbi:MAG: response regulator [Microcoleus sp. PH2017_10_PVI_O_A]|uniref:response regulator n=1 Tax=unclassified Microcoleus TaxID=2642155 RepID=UPI001D1E78EC|nr:MULTISPECIES: response regulator [unclassified Microcoleus]TAE81963.1 MAG: response regulator [Oscillatoriales cyanobacterium]MCC3406679.1 response regulator [Microcoleus sp. PH2017_10_PVI_O_A]MCC3460675.1 response regulator [Microcoleus sp. PH2017_11_PCY_U_A]MCC3479238.1 response regulator [Microcoleus sp. PH2017_12_PCY_D_A]MCC3528177.1 response regulator [Microcoleus sp. PH2017_21_RUC_O_A]
MQGNLSEIDIRSILQLIELGQRTGELFVEAYSFTGSSGNLPTQRSGAGQSWYVFCFNGQVIYATQSAGSLFRLRDYLRRYKADTALDKIQLPYMASTNAPEYGYLWALLENHILTPAQGRNIIHSMIHETLFDLLSLHQGSFTFEMGSALAPQLTSLEISSLLAKIVQQVQQWKQFHPHIQSPNQCPMISDPAELRVALPANTFNTLRRWADGHTSIRQMARYLNRDVLTVAKAIYPFVQQGLVQVFYEPSVAPANNRGGWSSPETKVKRVVCIDDDNVIRKTVESILNEQGYEATGISSPLEALSLVFKLKPDLILCDIAMPELDGYEICAMLRNSSAFRHTPIVMLTGIDGFIDRVKARMAGATDYFTKPFGESELLMLVEKYVGPGYPEANLSEKLLGSKLEDELEAK